MYYSSIGILALLILFINNYSILFRIPQKQLDISHKLYKYFLISVGIFYISDIIWAPLYTLKLSELAFAETSLFFVAMAIAVLLWTKYVIVYLNEKTKFIAFIKFTGWFLLFAQIIVLILNIFIPIAFWFGKDGIYHTGIARNLNLTFQLIMFLAVAIYMLFVAVKTEGNIRRRHNAIGLFSLIMVICIVLQIFYPLMPFYAIGYMLGTCLLHTFVLEDEKDVRREQLESILKVEKIQEIELGTTRKMAYSDPLTGVKNKMAYLEDVGGIDQRIQDKYLSNFGIIIFDINDLKKVNDSQGHDAGDQYIKNASSIICNHFKHSPVYRIGGDEFAVFISGDDYKNRDALLVKFNNLIEENLKNGQVVISFGFADFNPELDKNFLQLFDRADKQMYKRKKELKRKKSLKKY